LSENFRAGEEREEMKEIGKDRRIEKTRRVLHNALISLMKRKEYRSITIQEIIDEADVGRSTFYTHFEDKDALLLAGLHHLRDTLEAARAGAQAATGKPYERIIGFSLAMFEHAYAYREVYRALVGSQAGGLVLQYFPAMIAGLVRDEAASALRGRTGGVSAIPGDLLVHFHFIGLCLGPVMVARFGEVNGAAGDRRDLPKAYPPHSGLSILDGRRLVSDRATRHGGNAPPRDHCPSISPPTYRKAPFRTFAFYSRST